MHCYIGRCYFDHDVFDTRRCGAKNLEEIDAPQGFEKEETEDIAASANRNFRLVCNHIDVL